MDVRISVLGGDGIGPEVTTESVKVLDAIASRFGHDFTYITGLVGGCAIDATGSALPDDTLNIVLGSDAVLFGAVGGPKWDDLHAKVRPEDGILSLRKGLGLFANLRPCKVYPQLIDSSPLRPERLVDVDFIMVRELIGGLYFGKPKRRWENSRGRRAVDTLAYSEKEIERVVRIAFELARDRKKRVHSLDKMNVMESSRLWREVASEVGVEYPDVELIHMLADNAAMQLITNPSVFDVIVAENLFGDILSDEAAVIGGSLGMLPSASVSSLPPKHGRRRRGGKPALYEPIHGSAPDIAGKSLSNPMASILSAAMLLRLSLGLRAEAEAIENGIDSLLSEGYRTGDIASNGERPLTTSQVGDMVAGLVVG
ncbi:MAG: 3-isopropylmalate dehydrogenase [Chloroflexota bacterium]|jgi:3-isopropylmalate dehydrogenase|nr:3-isopropylmalate dehydrogenase [Chloroflexota bacterium]